MVAAAMQCCWIPRPTPVAAAAPLMAPVMTALRHHHLTTSNAHQHTREGHHRNNQTSRTAEPLACINVPWRHRAARQQQQGVVVVVVLAPGLVQDMTSQMLSIPRLLVMMSCRSRNGESPVHHSVLTAAVAAPYSHVPMLLVAHHWMGSWCAAKTAVEDPVV